MLVEGCIHGHSSSRFLLVRAVASVDMIRSEWNVSSLRSLLSRSGSATLEASESWTLAPLRLLISPVLPSHVLSIASFLETAVLLLKSSLTVDQVAIFEISGLRGYGHGSVQA